jgi:hypothetical protein
LCGEREKEIDREREREREAEREGHPEAWWNTMLVRT